MANLTITAASVLGSIQPSAFGIAGTTITAGMVLYLDSGTNTLKAADANASAATAAVVGIAAHGAYAGNRCYYITEDPLVTIGATVVPGVTYRLSSTAGLISDSAAASGDYDTVLGSAVNTTQLSVKIIQGGLKS